jgi:hypothetical protein
MSNSYGWDAAFCPDPAPKVIDGQAQSYGGFYLGGSSAFRVWTDVERRRLAGSGLRGMPIWVPTPGWDNPRQVALQAANALRVVGVPAFASPWRVLMWDFETGVEPDPAWFSVAHDTLVGRGYASLVYGSPVGSGLFSYQPGTGYMVADWDGVPELYPHPHVAGKQYRAGVAVPGGEVDLDVVAGTVLAHLGVVP